MRAAAAASWASQKAGRGKGSMIGGLIALKIDPTLMTQLGRGKRTVVVTGTNGKSTTTRMTAAALATLGDVATQADGANMDAGIVAALAARTDATLAALEVDELHVPHVADAVNPEVIVPAQPQPRSTRPGRRDQHDRTETARVRQRASECGDRRQLRRRTGHLRGIRRHQRRVGCCRRRLGRRFRQLPAHRRTHRVGGESTGAVPVPTSRGPSRPGGSTTTISTAPTA